MKPFVLLLLCLALLPGLGCSRKKKEISSRDRNEAAAFASEAEFAVSIRELDRAEGLLRQAAELCPDNGNYWLTLGNLCRKSGKVSDAQKAYAAASDAFADAYKADPKNPLPAMRQIYARALGGKVDDARALLKKMRASHPNNPQVMALDEKAFDEMLASPGFKELAI